MVEKFCLRYTDPVVAVPYFVKDTEGRLQRTHSTFTFKGDVDKRRVRRMIRRFLRDLGIAAPKLYIDHYIRRFTKR
jgi:transcription initiation factor TFIIIB Brf1 subunit/transcription initiation factor TFIIB